jgi:GNAT superfamily N-acetyltransferase
VDGTGANPPRHLTVVEVDVVAGPLDEHKLGWVAELYGGVDPKFRRDDVLEHLLVRGPAGPALHAFALADGTPIGHAAVIPTPARRGGEPLSAGKLEALVVAKEFRGRRGGRVPVARTLLHRLYESADARGIELIHAYVVPAVGRAIGFTRLDRIGAPSLVMLFRPRRDAGGRAAERALSRVQSAALRVAGAAARADAGLVRPLASDDADLLATPPVPRGSWAVVADGALDWYASSPSIRVLELGGAHGSRGLVQLPETPHEPLRVAAWTSGRSEHRAAVQFLLAAARLARSSNASTLRLQQQPHADATLSRAARALGFVRRADLTTLWVRTHDSSLARPDAVVSTPMLYLGF